MPGNPVPPLKMRAVHDEATDTLLTYLRYQKLSFRDLIHPSLVGRTVLSRQLCLRQGVIALSFMK